MHLLNHDSLTDNADVVVRYKKYVDLIYIYNLGKKLTKHLKQTREKLQIPLPPGQCWLNTVIYWCQAICR